MINYTSFILQNMKAIRPTTTKELCSQSITMLKMHEKVFKFHNHKNHCFKVPVYMINYTSWPIILPNMKAIGPTDTKSNYVGNALDQRLNRSCIHVMKSKSPITPAKIIESKCQDNMINYTSWLIILPDMKAIGPMTSEELHSQREVGWTHEQRKEGTNAQTYAPIKQLLSYATPL
jgi:hypothetical protein